MIPAATKVRSLQPIQQAPTRTIVSFGELDWDVAGKILARCTARVLVPPAPTRVLVEVFEEPARPLPNLLTLWIPSVRILMMLLPDCGLK